MYWIYDIPAWLVCGLIVSVLVSAAIGGHRLWRRFVCWECNAESNALALGMLAVVAMMLSLLLAFSSVSVWEAYSSAEAAAANEASVSGELVRDLAVHGGPKAAAAREAVRSYIESVIADDWPAMARGGSSDVTAHKFNAIFRAAALLEPRTAREEVMLREIWTKTNLMNESRRARIAAALGSAIPPALWGTLLLGILINFMLFYLRPWSRVNELMLGMYAAMLGLMIFFIIVMDRPYAGSVNVSPHQMESALQSMARWDSETVAGK
ncbi:MAG: DUF4239 domain-containing protein [Elusimicrobia bacterium]|nr:DUF4239 domain-containing protein [Elusimicrobiota bacterium]